LSGKSLPNNGPYRRFWQRCCLEPYFFSTSLTEPTQAHRALEWVNTGWEALQPFSGGRNYVNYLSVHDEAGVKSAYGTNYPRLVALKNRYDPTNFFHLNRNIRPTL
jgi:Berberine and berberine like